MVWSAQSTEFSHRGRHQKVSAGQGTDEGDTSNGISVVWDSGSIRLFKGPQSGDALATMQWRDVSGIWASFRVKEATALLFEVDLEAKSGDMDFLCLRGPVNEASGRFLDFVQAVKAEKLKEGRAPSFAMSSWAAPLYQNGLTCNRVRVALGWTSIIFEVLFATCFLSQIQRIFLSRESKLLQELHDISKDLGRLQGLGTFLVLLQHILVFVILLQSLWSTVRAALRSLHVFHRATKKATKSIKKLSSGSTDVLGGDANKGPGLTGEAELLKKSLASEGTELRQRRGAE